MSGTFKKERATALSLHISEVVEQKPFDVQTSAIHCGAFIQTEGLTFFWRLQVSACCCGLEANVQIRNPSILGTADHRAWLNSAHVMASFLTSLALFYLAQVKYFLFFLCPSVIITTFIISHAKDPQEGKPRITLVRTTC